MNLAIVGYGKVGKRIEQLAPDGVIVAPVGPSGAQQLKRFRRDGDAMVEDSLGSVSFVPLLGGLG